ncbi:MAG: hypothetical protein LBO73_00140, partial [Holosporaceae bacterium]|nr:hypothetical protein [Holosporaceae bacterium]
MNMICKKKICITLGIIIVLVTVIGAFFLKNQHFRPEGKKGNHSHDETSEKEHDHDEKKVI